MRDNPANSTESLVFPSRAIPEVRRLMMGLGYSPADIRTEERR